jgi:small-conductance mechanosensitive channel
MIMRVKFTTPPGEQFVVRKEVLKRMQEAFRQNGIEFAHRNVTVYMPPENSKEENSDGTQKEQLRQAHSAAAAGLLHQEQQSPTHSNDDDR